MSTLSQLFKKIYPVGCLYLSVDNVNPSTLFGGTWVAFGSGRTLVGVDTGQTEFNTVEKMAGDKTVTLTVDQIPSHNHRLIHYNDDYNNTGGGYPYGFTYDGATSPVNDNYLSANTGGGQAHNNLPPYITCYIWKRTA